MIQRIQTLYLLLVVVLSNITLFSPVVDFMSEDKLYTLTYKGVLVLENGQQINVLNTWALTAISSIIPLVALISIFLFKKRILQIRLNVFNALLMGGYYVLFFMYVWLVKERFNVEATFHIPASFHLINIVLTYLAIRGIGKDEALVRSFDRLR